MPPIAKESSKKELVVHGFSSPACFPRKRVYEAITVAA
jgi:hypothetical protein